LKRPSDGVETWPNAVDPMIKKANRENMVVARRFFMVDRHSLRFLNKTISTQLAMVNESLYKEGTLANLKRFLLFYSSVLHLF